MNINDYENFKKLEDRVHILEKTIEDLKLEILSLKKSLFDIDAMANAKLIAASPDMLKALIKCYSHIKNDMTICGLVVETKEAIEQATGLTINEVLEKDYE